MLLKKSKKYKIGIALSGGGARGFAHLGILKALKEKGIEPDIISGTSAGAIVGAFICAGKEPEEALDIIKSYKYFDIRRINFPKTGLFNLNILGHSIHREINYRNIEDLPKPLLIAATDMMKGEIKYFSEGSLPKCVQASSSIPVLFKPVNINGKLYSDGGALDNLPIKPIKKLCKKTIAINISPLLPITEMKNIMQVATRMLQLSVNAHEQLKNNQADFYIEPPDVNRYDILDRKHAKEIFNVGYNYAKNMDIDL